MKKKLTPIGNSLGIVIEKPILELLGLTRDSELEVTTDGEKLLLVPTRGTAKKSSKPAKPAKAAKPARAPKKR